MPCDQVAVASDNTSAPIRYTGPLEVAINIAESLLFQRSVTTQSDSHSPQSQARSRSNAEFQTRTQSSRTLFPCNQECIVPARMNVQPLHINERRNVEKFAHFSQRFVGLVSKLATLQNQHLVRWEISPQPTDLLQIKAAINVRENAVLQGQRLSAPFAF